MAKSSTHTIFVYGTLKKGRPNHGPLEGAVFLGYGILDGNFRIFDLGWYPGVSRADSSTRILGEVWRIGPDALQRIDMIEGHPSYYEREKLSIRMLDGSTYRAWTYLLPQYEYKDSPTVDGVWQPTQEEAEIYADSAA